MRRFYQFALLSFVLGCAEDPAKQATEPPAAQQDTNASLDTPRETATDGDGDGYADGEDCDDSNPAINPLATDIVGDGIDQNCDGLDGTDQDGDGHASLVSGGDDCDDDDDDISPSAQDTVGDGVDNNCDGVDGVDATDADGDGYGGDLDCNDSNQAINPLATDIVGDGIDQNCDGLDGTDQDGDGHASVASGGEDCRDDDETVFPGAPDAVGDGIDNDCDGFDGQDADGDGYGEAVDCNDSNPAINPLATDIVGDGIDQNCDDIDGTDQDGDGHASQSSGGDDCDDDDPTAHPGATEVWYDGIDSDCDGACDFDADGDGHVLAGHLPTDGDGCDLDPSPGVGWAPEDCDDSDADIRHVSVGRTWPSPNTTGAYYRTHVEVTMNGLAPGPTLQVTDAAGALVAGTTIIDGRYLEFIPASPLTPASTYDVDLTWSCGQTQWSFTTTEVGLPTDTSVVTDSTYILDLAAARFPEPRGVGDVLLPFLEQEAPILVSFHQLTPAVEGLMARATEFDAEQDACLATQSLTDGDFTEPPYFSLAMDELVFTETALYGTSWTEVELTGAFSPDGTTIEGITLSGLADARPMASLILGSGSDADDYCMLMATIGVPCEACPDGEPYCIAYRMDDIVAEQVPGLTLVEISQDDVDANPQCP